ncbi:MAG: hypothetical protein JSW59_03870 [Phycisphaerales bacterium]|nr:MAG: hypothetical protein JSW59_03870 [Phycisphaerales bacterium]
MAKAEDEMREVLSDRQESDRQTDGRVTRSLFLRRGVAALAGAVCLARCGVKCEGAPRSADNTADRTAPLMKLKSRKESQIKSWDVITIGNLSRNRYWGESDDRGVRSAICTCTLIRGDGFNVLVDPSLKDENQMRSELDRRTRLEGYHR